MEFIDQLKGLGPAGLLLIFLCCIGAALKKTKWFSDRIIPVLLMVLGGVTYPFLARQADIDYTSSLIGYNAAFGAVLGWASIGAHQLFKQTFPLVFPKSGDTEIVKKDQ